MQQHNVSFNFKARYCTQGSVSNHTERIWLICHGYGQLAPYFIKKFAALPIHDRVIVPEGLSRFYMNGFSGRVGATWMTKEERLTDIDNYLTYLSEVYHLEVQPYIGNGIEVNLLGFSQGASTISRFAVQQRIGFDRLVLWAGVFPPDTDMAAAKDRLYGKAVYMVYGNADNIIQPKHVAEQRTAIQQLGIKPAEIVYDGGHDIMEQPLLQLINS